jgi:hypothetical protein
MNAFLILGQRKLFFTGGARAFAVPVCNGGSTHFTCVAENNFYKQDPGFKRRYLKQNLHLFQTTIRKYGWVQSECTTEKLFSDKGNLRWKILWLCPFASHCCAGCKGANVSEPPRPEEDPKGLGTAHASLPAGQAQEHQHRQLLHLQVPQVGRIPNTHLHGPLRDSSWFPYFVSFHPLTSMILFMIDHGS